MGQPSSTFWEYPDTPEGSLMKNVRASVAEFERLKISERMNSGRELKVKAGSVPVYSRPPLFQGCLLSFRLPPLRKRLAWAQVRSSEN